MPAALLPPSLLRCPSPLSLIRCQPCLSAGALLFSTIVLSGFVEFKRLNDIRNPGSQVRWGDGSRGDAPLCMLCCRLLPSFMPAAAAASCQLLHQPSCHAGHPAASSPAITPPLHA